MNHLPKDIHKRCELFGDQFDILALMLRDSYLTDTKASRSQSALREYFKKHAKEKDEIQTNFIVDQHIMSVTLGDSKRMARLLAQERHDLNEDSIDVLSHWIEHPAFFLFFSIENQVGIDLFTVRDLFSGATHLVHSRSLAFCQDRRETRDKHYLTLMYDNGLCLQTAGLLHYSDLDVDEMRFLLESLDRELFARGGVDEVLKAHPKGIYFYRLLANRYELSAHGEDLVICYSQFDSLDYTFDEQYWKVEKKGRLCKYTLVEASPEMGELVGDVDLLDYYCERQAIQVFQLGERWIVLTTTVWGFFVASKVLGLEKTEAAHYLDVMLVLMVERERLATPWFPFILSDENAESVAQSEETKGINELMNHYIKETNQGHAFDLGAEAKRFGVDLERAREAVEQFQEDLKRRSWAVPEEEKQYEIEGCPIPPPIKRRDFGDSLFVTEHFEFGYGNKAALHQLTDAMGIPLEKDEISMNEILAMMETVFSNALGGETEGLFCVSSLLWIILHSPHEPMLVRGLALEIYKISPAMAEIMDYEIYVEQFSSAVMKSFVAFHLFSLQQRPSQENRRRGLYTIKATEVLRALVKPLEITGEREPIVRFLG